MQTVDIDIEGFCIDVEFMYQSGVLGYVGSLNAYSCVFASPGLRILSLGFGVSSRDTYQLGRSILAGMPPPNIRRQHIPKGS